TITGSAPALPSEPGVDPTSSSPSSALADPTLASPSTSPTPSPSTAGPSSRPGAGAAGIDGSGGSPTAGGSADGGPSLGPLTDALPPFGSDAWFRLAAESLAASTTASTAMALALFGLRRRREEDEDEGKATNPYQLPSEPLDPIVAATQSGSPAASPAAGDPEASMPRWRRPSLRAARRSDPTVDLGVVEAERLTFEHGIVHPTGERELRRIRYRMVRLGDGPDEILSTEIGRLDEGDEVELLKRSGAYWQVRTPLGQVGWVHRMTLGELLPPDPTRIPAGGGELDPDVLAAYGESQLRMHGALRDVPVGEGLASRMIRERLSHR
ncbi:MAG TPA: hypothetical protein VFW92_05195, partial [Candidatus Limnocylindrales bacterium]|nr:hypothetical protein [Candidatus Limnocylindrales bacterium]